MLPANQEHLSTFLAREWATNFTSVIQGMADNAAITCEPLGDDVGAGELAQFAWWTLKLNLLSGPSIWIGASAEAWKNLGEVILSAVGVDSPDPSDVTATCQDVVAQTGSLLAGWLATQVGVTVNADSPTSGDSPAHVTGANLVAAIEGNPLQMTFAVRFADALLEHILKSAAESANDADDAPEPEEKPPVSDDLGFIAGLQLAVHVVLGRAVMPLRDVLTLTAGSIIHLDRGLSDPADLVVAGRMVGQGRVVVCNGNYGLTIVSTSPRKGER
ncbi:MAG: FliM/FliN family flagellar motor switch protein [Bryobacteraceae bacterium]